MNWPNDADGDALQKFEQQGFDFSKTQSIDFNVDFDTWPPPTKAVEILKEKYPDLELIESDITAEDPKGYIVFRIEDKLTYDFVIRIQKEVTNLVKKYGGVCESWGAFSS